HGAHILKIREEMEGRAAHESDWEYIRVLSGSDDASLHDTIQKMARDGWELVGAPPRGKTAQPLEAAASSRPFRKKNKNRNMLFAAVALVAALIVFFTIFDPSNGRNYPPITISQVVADVKDGKISRIVIFENSDDID